MPYLLSIIVFLFGIVIGSFLNVCILRIPEGESIVTERSHCTSCGHVLQWYDLFPLFSYLFLRGRCRYCGAHISAQYPVIEGLNGVLWVVTSLICGWSIDTVLICMLISALIVLSVIDWRTYEIPFGVNVFIFVLGMARVVLKLALGQNAESFRRFAAVGSWGEHMIGFFAVSGFLLLVYLITKGKGIGGGDIKLMAAAGLFLGWRMSLLSLILGCFFGSVIHIARMKLSGEGKMLALGPYLSGGMLLTLWVGEQILRWYSGFFR